MNAVHKKVLQSKFAYLLDEVDADDICDFLFSNSILNTNDFESIRNEKTKRDKCRTLLLLLPKKGPSAYSLFLKSLKEKHWIEKELCQEEEKIKQEKPLEEGNRTTQPESASFGRASEDCRRNCTDSDVELFDDPDLKDFLGDSCWIAQQSTLSTADPVLLQEVNKIARRCSIVKNLLELLAVDEQRKEMSWYLKGDRFEIIVHNIKRCLETTGLLLHAEYEDECDDNTMEIIGIKGSINGKQKVPEDQNISWSAKILEVQAEAEKELKLTKIPNVGYYISKINLSTEEQYPIRDDKKPNLICVEERKQRKEGVIWTANEEAVSNEEGWSDIDSHLMEDEPLREEQVEDETTKSTVEEEKVTKKMKLINGASMGLTISRAEIPTTHLTTSENIAVTNFSTVVDMKQGENTVRKINEEGKCASQYLGAKSEISGDENHASGNSRDQSCYIFGVIDWAVSVFCLRTRRPSLLQVMEEVKLTETNSQDGYDSVSERELSKAQVCHSKSLYSQHYPRNNEDDVMPRVHSFKKVLDPRCRLQVCKEKKKTRVDNISIKRS